MKKILPCCLLLTFSIIHTIAHAQTCTREVPAFNAAPGGYTINGSAVLESVNDAIHLYFDSAFGTQSGPDLYVYLAVNFEAPSVPGNTNVELGELISNTGAQSYDVPSDVELGEYAFVLIHCKMFNHWWGGGPLGEIECVSATDDIQDPSASFVYPNPATDYITLNWQGEGVEKIVVIDILGNIRLKQLISNQDQLNVDVSGLENGLFFVAGVDAKGEFVFRKHITKSSN